MTRTQRNGKAGIKTEGKNGRTRTRSARRRNLLRKTAVVAVTPQMTHPTARVMTKILQRNDSYSNSWLQQDQHADLAQAPAPAARTRKNKKNGVQRRKVPERTSVQSATSPLWILTRWTDFFLAFLS